jgi:hypothetical protein
MVFINLNSNPFYLLTVSAISNPAGIEKSVEYFSALARLKTHSMCIVRKNIDLKK